MFNPDSHNVLGIVTRSGSSNNARIVVQGLVTKSNGMSTLLSAAERDSLFPTNCVFAYDFLSHHPHWLNECVCIGAKPNNNINVTNGDDFVWDWGSETYIYAKLIKKIPFSIGEDGNDNCDVLSKVNLLNPEEVTYFISGKTLYKREPKGRLLQYWDVQSVADDILSYNGYSYLLNDIRREEDGRVDVTSDTQLVEWYKKNILRKEWNTIYEAKDFKTVDSLLTEILAGQNVPSNVYKSRLKRLRAISSNISLSYSELQELSTASWFKRVIEGSISEAAEKYIDKMSSDHKEEIKVLEQQHMEEIEILKKSHAEEIESIKNHHATELSAANNSHKEAIENFNMNLLNKQNELDSLKQEIESAVKEQKEKLSVIKTKISEMDACIASKENEIERLESRKESIIADFSIIREVLGQQSRSYSKDICSLQPSIIFLEDKAKKVFPNFGPFRKNIESYLVKFLGTPIIVDEIITALASHLVILLPDNPTISAILYACGQCHYLVEYVGVDWKSYSDLWDNGLSEIVSHARKDEDTVHFLVLKNINMSFIPCYLQPIIDIEEKLVSDLPGTDIPFPKNLRILCSRTSETVIPILGPSLQGIKCIAPGANISAAHRKLNASSGLQFFEGHLSSSLLAKLPETLQYSENNPIESYIDE